MRRYSWNILQWRKIKTKSTNFTQWRLLFCFCSCSSFFFLFVSLFLLICLPIFIGFAFCQSYFHVRQLLCSMTCPNFLITSTKLGRFRRCKKYFFDYYSGDLNSELVRYSDHGDYWLHKVFP